MSEKIALITGANKGLGFEAAHQLAKTGVHVIIGSRDRNKGISAALKIQAEGLSAEVLPLDVTSSSSIADAAREVEKKHGRLDILINNAGVLLDDPTIKPSQQKLETWRKTFDSNVFGLVETTLAFLPLLHKSKAGRIVNLSSILGSNTLHQDPASPIYEFKIPAYNVSKSAVNAWTVHLAHELKDSKIKVNAAHPGHVKTEMGGAGASMEIVDGAKTSVQLALLADDGPNGAFVHLGEALPW
ncbi:SDR family oxidoreductase [Stenotrophobium rhamnosiphilum]|uniref:Short-chain dehydrogenase n=1 Tax=Stenotrophobium rhamnosiphilum TaxID=2029166 RepID=A0A2T5ME53_9GAMM|nr:SDR family oxidoreductase [Stenotrophobium rhamnosiphilum]PTU30846.1 short-chain dehydrogenase [Stenotrophobium rhamnosiphilum]